ncbi:probable inactive receptor kinase At1g27190 [Dioscorea cayenensis subsp. rotundata]|uniref:Probable inactive receptor kinase At1g27190 n=1 Tax=Dioscorea cayennensis subsp. rotundata TaxID=55577 RepID=A0AB40BEA9_DIOCR|nr:probable inactive receptor kinase At1g27190 [Dioscorea cayenensis subsp. rotundata]
MLLPLHLQLLLLFTAASSTAVASDDARCLRGVRDAFSTSSTSPFSWNFANQSAGFVCSFSGVTCWNDQENRVLTLSLPSMSLSGSIPSDLQYCSSLQNLDLSGNSISGPLPSSLCDWLPYLVTLDLSSNSLSGQIPSELSNCRFLNTLLLSDNRLSGPIPLSLSRLERLKRLSLSGNQLSGTIPSSLSHFDSSSFDGNPSLCGHPLRSCGRSLTRTGLIIIIASGVLGAAASLLLAYAVWRWCFSPSSSRLKRRAAAAGEDGRLWADRLRASQHRLAPVSLFQKPIVKVKLADLMSATNDFRNDHIVVAGSSRTGTSYKAVLRDGSALTVKRLNGCVLPEKQFRAEMSRLGQLRHPNLVPLLGFCIVEEERLLVYKNMPGGALSTLLRSGNGDLDWPTRLKIGIGTARGLAWLHHGFEIPYLHQNLSSSAVLLDEDYDPRLTDFCLARLVKTSTNSNNSNTNTNTSPFMNGDFGDFGYVAPEYATTPVATMKGDVYAFGVVLLELATGQKPTEISTDAAGEVFKGSLVDWVNQLANAGQINDAIDRSIRGKGYDDEIVQCLIIACSCVVARLTERPSMYKVYNSLKSVGKGRETDEFDEFPLNFGKDDAEA